ncbi:hypothetical protein [Allorhizobium borbori]|uniref:TauD/TfdA-like domain-containing protein n=1 Tax=Allorhizobium borbori TaxID=485907 RepID=A0A7W6K170_9HYPH|nr:hypothetical protein [Allorhizobium borbori]MBB4103288.1 hypothetical protein [Allorhizobium borbori]
MDEIVWGEIRAKGFYQRNRSLGSALPSLRSLIADLKPRSLRVDRLYPRKKNEAKPNSLSAYYGTGAFPPHTDFALKSLPPKYVALFCPVARLGMTTLYDGSSLRAAVKKTGTFRIHSLGKAYSANFFNSNKYGEFYRYNRDLMKPLDENAHKLGDMIEHASPDHVIDWENIAWVLIDNWKILHGRQETHSTGGWLWRYALDTIK